MKIIDQSHEILRMDGLDIIERAGRTCYKSEENIGCALPEHLACTYLPEDSDFTPMQHEDGECAQWDCPNHSSQKFVQQLIKRGHEAMLEHGVAAVRFVTNRGVTHELVRHRVASFAQESTRYVKYDGEMEFIRPVWCSEKLLGEWSAKSLFAAGLGVDEPCALWAYRMKAQESTYIDLLHLGWLPEQAREVLPNSLKTEIVVTANYREWRHILNLRAVGTTGRPHPQMKALMMPVLEEFKAKLPALFGDLGV